MTDDDASEQAAAIHDAVRAYAAVEFPTLARKVVAALQKIGASGNYGDDFAFKSLWDEYCFEVQHGPTVVNWAWQETIPPFLDAVIDRTPRHASLLLSIDAAYYLAGDDHDGLELGFWKSGMRRVLRQHLDDLAAGRSLRRFSRWEEDFFA